uniref:Uncharacterized protein n=1 Tax=Pyrodinium bahamense TaxID=73915 RepID=A0A7S0FQH2_9DINO|mmetsp:Transcript_40853/g.113594  ORF Transcript_40853/g.113594 Transcript_40853/m.113594 type:complete len:185 (+) Transcript_40853:100-654(+)
MGAIASVIGAVVSLLGTAVSLAAASFGVVFTSTGISFMIAEGLGIVAEAYEGVEKLSEETLKHITEGEKLWIKVASGVILAPFLFALWSASFIFLLSYRNVFASKVCMQVLPAVACVHLAAMICAPRIWWMAVRISFLASPVVGWALNKAGESMPRVVPVEMAPPEDTGEEEPDPVLDGPTQVD